MSDGQDRIKAIEARLTNCGNCKHQVMKAGFRGPRCRAPGHDNGINAQTLRSPASFCPEGNWLELPPENTLLLQITERNRIVTEANRRGAICDTCEITTCALKGGCSGCKRRSLLQNPMMVCPADPPRWGPIRREREPVKATWVFSVYNEPLIADTLKSFKDSMVDPKVELDFVIIDDGSDDGCCDNLPYEVIRNEASLGIGSQLNRGTDIALERGADVVGVSDPHMIIPPGTVEAHVWKALEEPCVVCSATYGWVPESRMRQWGAYWVKTTRDCIAARWIGGKWPLVKGAPFAMPTEEWTQVQICLGAFYADSAETIGIMKEPTGRLWETTVGRWGFLLEPFSFKAYFLGVPILVSRDGYTRHFYRTKNPVANAAVEKTRNTAFGAASVFSEQTFNKYFKHWCESRGGIMPGEIDRLAAEGRKGVKRSWTVEEEEELLQSIPEMEDEKDPDKAIPFEKMMLSRRDKLMRSRKARNKGV